MGLGFRVRVRVAVQPHVRAVELVELDTLVSDRVRDRVRVRVRVRIRVRVRVRVRVGAASCRKASSRSSMFELSSFFSPDEG